MVGLDISDYQTITSLPSTITFLIRKAGEGLLGEGDHVGADNLSHDIALAKILGKQTAIYWFVHPGESALDQANMAIAAARKTGVHGIACDCEVSDGQSLAVIEQVIKDFLGYVRKAGFQVLLYDNVSWISQLKSESWGYPIWLADPSHVVPVLACVCHQYGVGSISGVKGTCDLDRWMGDQVTYDLFFNGPPAPKPPVKKVYMQTVVAVPTDTNGNGFKQTTIEYSKFVAATHQGTTSNQHYAGGEVHVNQVNGHLAVSVTGAVVDGTANVIVVTE